MNDDSDKIFFEAYVSDLKSVAHSLNLRKRMLGIQDQDTNESLEDEKHSTQEEFEEELANQIDYIIGIILRNGGQSYQNEIIEILINYDQL